MDDRRSIEESHKFVKETRSAESLSQMETITAAVQVMSDQLPDAVYGFIGLGNMGFGMAKNLRKSMPTQSKLVVCELNTIRRDEFISTVDGLVEAADSPRELAETCVRFPTFCSDTDISPQDIIITSLPDGNAVRTVFTDASQGLLAAPKVDRKQKLFLECSTIEVRTSNEVLKEVENSGLGDFLDSPVSGGIPSAHQATLSVMVGGSRHVFERAKPILASMGKEENIVYCGTAGAGLATKQINNYVANVSYIALCEGMHLTFSDSSDFSGMNTGLRYGLDPKILAGR